MLFRTNKQKIRELNKHHLFMDFSACCIVCFASETCLGHSTSCTGTRTEKSKFVYHVHMLKGPISCTSAEKSKICTLCNSAERPKL